MSERSDNPRSDAPDLVVGTNLEVGTEGRGRDGRRYRILTRVQRGGMGELFIAQVDRPGDPPERVVIKRLLAHLIDDQKYRRMFRAEAEVMARLEHPNIVRLLDTPTIAGAPCLALELVHGRSLQQILHRHERLRRPVPPRVALTVLARALRGLHHAHTLTQADGRPLDLVHRDVTPGNVLVGYDGSVKLTDFGIAKSKASLVSTTEGIVKGKARYLAPEQILGEPATPRSDVYSAAVVAVELLCARPLYARATIPDTLHAIVRGERPPMAQLLPDARDPLGSVLDRALAVEPERRPPSAEAFAQAILLALEPYGGPIGAPDLGGYMRAIFADRAPLPPLAPGTRGEDGTAGDEAAVTDDEPTVEAVPRESPPGATIVPADGARDPSSRVSAREASKPASVRDRAPHGRGGLGPLTVGFALGTAVGVVGTLGVVGRPAEPGLHRGAAGSRARLDILSPPGARVYLDGLELAARAPILGVVIAPGPHTLRVESAADDIRWSWSFDARPGDRIEARKRLRIYSVEAPGEAGEIGVTGARPGGR